MKIAIIEKGHYEVCYTLLRLFGDDDEITVFVDWASYLFLREMCKDEINKFEWVVQDKNEPNSDFIKRIFEWLSLNNCDVCYASTLSDNFHLFASGLRERGKMKSIMTLHNINNFFSKPGVFNLRTIGRWWGKRQLLKQLDAFTVLSPMLLPAAREKIPPAIPVFYIPGSFFDAANYVAPLYQPGRVIQITVPGSVDERRRNYDAVFELLELVESHKLPVHITLLGAFENNFSRRIRLQCEHHLKDNDNLTIFEQAVDPAMFDEVIRQSHFIWAPLREKITIHDGIEEQYSRTTSSGIIGDIVRHARPFFAPSFLRVDPLLREAGFFYESISDLADYLNRINVSKYNLLVTSSLYFSNLHQEETVKNNAIVPFRDWVKSDIKPQIHPGP